MSPPVQIDIEEETEACILSIARLYNNHPHEGQMYLDFFPLFSTPAAFELVISTFVTHILKTYDVNQIAAIVYPEAQGFILGPLIASRLQIPSVAVRKPGKLSGDCYIQEFGKWGKAQDAMEIQREAFVNINLTGEGGKRKGAIIIDDSVATGGSVGAVKKLVERFDIPVLEIVTIIHASWEEFTSQQRANGLEGTKIFACAKLTEDIMGRMKMYDGRRDKDGKRLP
jgi:adenine phosphoribosyltransferase